MEHHSLNMQLPRGWYQVANATPHTFRRHCLTSNSGTLQLWLLPPHREPVASGEEAHELLKQTLTEQDMHVGMPLKTGCEDCAAGILVFAVYKHIGGQREYWLIPSPDATVFACWQMGAMTTAGMERHDIHDMLQKLHFEHTEEADEEESPFEEAAAGEEGEGRVTYEAEVPETPEFEPES